MPAECRRDRPARLRDVSLWIGPGAKRVRDVQLGAKRGVDQGVAQQHCLLVAHQFAD